MTHYIIDVGTKNMNIVTRKQNKDILFDGIDEAEKIYMEQVCDWAKQINPQVNKITIYFYKIIDAVSIDNNFIAFPKLPINIQKACTELSIFSS